MTGWWLASYIVLWLLLVATLGVLLVVLRQLGLVYASLESRPPARPRGPTIGNRFSLSERDQLTGEKWRPPLREDELALLLFVSPSCSSCSGALEGVEELFPRPGVSLTVVSEGGAAENADLRGRLEGVAPIVSSERIRLALDIPSVPYAAVLGSDGTMLHAQPVMTAGDLGRAAKVAAGESSDAPEGLALHMHGGNS